MSEHTPGPWTCAPFLVGTGMVVKDSRGHSLVTTATFRPWEETEANARLIAVAPEMAALLDECYDALPHGELTTRIAALLARVKGASGRRPTPDDGAIQR